MKYLFWFVVCSQFLYCPEALKAVDARTKEIATELSKVLLYLFIYKVATNTNSEITGIVVMGLADDVEASAMPKAT